MPTHRKSLRALSGSQARERDAPSSQPYTVWIPRVFPRLSQDKDVLGYTALDQYLILGNRILSGIIR